MKLFIGIIVSVLLVQTLALPTFEDPSKPEELPTEVKPRNEQVEAFRRDIMFQFQRFQTFYDLFNGRMTAYRTDHADLATEIGLILMEVFSIDLDLVRESKDYANLQVDNALERLGGSPNACLQEVIDTLALNSARLGEEFNACAVRANRTISNGLADIFYPTFDEIQRSASIVPILTVSALSRGNAFDDGQNIIDYLDNQFRALDLQWKSAASQLFRWETARFDIEGRFYVEEIRDCLVNPIENYLNTNTFYVFRIVDECSPMK